MAHCVFHIQGQATSYKVVLYNLVRGTKMYQLSFMMSSNTMGLNVALLLEYYFFGHFFRRATINPFTAKLFNLNFHPLTRSTTSSE